MKSFTPRRFPSLSPRCILDPTLGRHRELECLAGGIHLGSFGGGTLGFATSTAGLFEDGYYSPAGPRCNIYIQPTPSELLDCRWFRQPCWGTEGPCPNAAVYCP